MFGMASRVVSDISSSPVSSPVKGTATASGRGEALMSHTGHVLVRATTFRFTLDPAPAQHQHLLAHAGASRWAFNYHLGRVKANLDQRDAERSYGVAEARLTPSLSWSKVSFINQANAFKNGTAADSPVNEDGTRGLAWRGEVSTDVFETASVNAAQALANFTSSKNGSRKAKAAGFPKFKSRHRTRPAFRLRSKSKPGATSPVRTTGPKMMRFPKIGQIRVRESTRRLRLMLQQGRFHVYAASFRLENGRWHVCVTGVAADLHHQRRNPRAEGRVQERTGVDLGVKTLAVIADETGRALHAYQGVKSLQQAQERLTLAGQAFSRTKKGSNGRAKAAQRLGRIHARVANLRKALLHQITCGLAKGHSHVTVEDLNAAGMLKNRCLARAVADASFAELRRQLEYKCGWFGTELLVADRWFPSSKTCSGCGRVQPMPLHVRVFDCPACGLVLDRDVNAAVNLARYRPDKPRPARTGAPPVLAA
jgi:putative transposase